MLCVIATNSVACRFFHYEKASAKLSFIKEITHPENRLKKEEYLTSDKSGSFKSGISSQGSYEQRTDPKANEINNFAREIGKEIEKGRINGTWSQLIVISTPQMEGLILKQLEKKTISLIRNYIQNDPQHLKEQDLLNLLREKATFPD